MGDMKAYFRREERYEGLQVVFDKRTSNREEVLKAIEDLKEEMGLIPEIFENCYEDDPNRCAFYIEFSDDYDRKAGEFFERLLNRLGIEHAE